MPSNIPQAPSNAILRLQARRDKISQLAANEIKTKIESLKARPDYKIEYSYFLDLLSAPLASRLAAINKPAVAFLCQVAPLELIEAHGLHPYRLFGGHHASERLSAPNLPAVMCPMLRSLLGHLMTLDLGGDDSFKALIIPTMCDWTVKFDSLSNLCGLKLPKVHLMDPSRVKNSPQAPKRWLGETSSLNKFLESLSGRKIGPRELSRAIETYQEAYLGFSQLIDLKRKLRLPQIWFSVIASSFYLDTVQNWTKAVKGLLAALCLKDKIETNDGHNKKSQNVFLAGSPIFFPNFKMLDLLEEAGLMVVIDDLCSSERLLPGPVFITDHSFYGLLTALSQRYHLGCLCPTFADHHHAVNKFTNIFINPIFKGIIFHVLKGCHLFDLKSLAVEPNVKELGIKFLRVETDYAKEDANTLLTRLEAFGSSLGVA
ncbi:MAG: 2-hydroxyacyl-CoA dehydratase family protein [Deltaproteobacteria bacterium]|jgi:benzoyl-CoA reductase/2-hydroxyglutaryl-CoA dehydratase subunit BcrC/BadD/HgdB|nr:2-hydroxyacyl-CoA dehydratase family protein [Deltaproteobacteria bacterium]